MWMFNDPCRTDPAPEADRLLDRIDIAMHLIVSQLSMEPPVRPSGSSDSTLARAGEIKSFSKG